MRSACVSFLLMLTMYNASVQGHEARPVLINLTELGANSFMVELVVPAAVPDNRLPSLSVPAGCAKQALGVHNSEGNLYKSRQRLDCDNNLSGTEMALEFPSGNPSLSMMFQLTRLNGERHVQLLGPGDSTWVVPENESRGGVATQYTWLGMTHIWLGIDHLLFILCLLFIARTPKRIFATITGFTLAHSVTLALSSLGLVNIPIAPVEAAIALSIVFLAAEIVNNNQQSWTYRYPTLVASSFGLLHGLGFASALGEIGLPQIEITTGLLFFNLGVEAGQILFIVAVVAAAFLISGLFKGVTKKAGTTIWTARVPNVTAYTIGSVAAYWLLVDISQF